MSHLRVRAGKAVALALLVLLGSIGTARAQSVQPAFWFSGTRLIFDRPDRVDNEIAVRGSDPGLRRFLARVGATLSWQPTSRYAVVTTADRRTLTFTLGVPQFQTSTGGETPPLHAYVDGNEIYLPFLTLARALYVQPVLIGDEYVLVPGIGSLNARADGRRTIVSLVGATQLRFVKSVDDASRLTLVFNGNSSTLAPSRTMEMPSLARVDITVGGSVRSPTTSITFVTPPGTSRTLLPSTNGNELVFAFGPQEIASVGTPIPAEGTSPVTGTLAALPAATPLASTAPAVATAATPAATPQPDATVAAVTGIDIQNPASDALLIHVATSPGLSFEWHRLGTDRFYIDFANATLTAASRSDQSPVAFVQAYRINQLPGAAVPTVRVAFTTTPNRRIEVLPDSAGVTITIADVDASTEFMAKVGSGMTGGQDVAVVAPATPLPPGAVPAPAGANPRLIVLDPGHGGSDTGAMRNGIVEKDVTLDITMRLRTLLVARGWLVKLTRETDKDVYGPNASDVNELQARVDAANNAGARMFLSIHANSSTSSVPSGTTTYYYKPEDRALALAVQQHLVSVLGTKDDGIVRERFYVVRRATMPACLVETVFLSNASDAARLRSPDFRQQIAVGIADGIRDYAGQPASSVSVQQ